MRSLEELVDLLKSLVAAVAAVENSDTSRPFERLEARTELIDCLMDNVDIIIAALEEKAKGEDE